MPWFNIPDKVIFSLSLGSVINLIAPFIRVFFNSLNWSSVFVGIFFNPSIILSIIVSNNVFWLIAALRNESIAFQIVSLFLAITEGLYKLGFFFQILVNIVSICFANKASLSKMIDLINLIHASFNGLTSWLNVRWIKSIHLSEPSNLLALFKTSLIISLIKSFVSSFLIIDLIRFISISLIGNFSSNFSIYLFKSISFSFKSLLINWVYKSSNKALILSTFSFKISRFRILTKNLMSVKLNDLNILIKLLSIFWGSSIEEISVSNVWSYNPNESIDLNEFLINEFNNSSWEALISNPYCFA